MNRAQQVCAWKRDEFKVAINPQAWEARSDSGLRSGYIRGPFGIASQTWYITHLPSGLMVCQRAATLREAKEIVAELLPLLDWTVADPLRIMGEEVREQVLRIVKRRDPPHMDAFREYLQTQKVRFGNG